MNKDSLQQDRVRNYIWFTRSLQTMAMILLLFSFALAGESQYNKAQKAVQEGDFVAAEQIYQQIISSNDKDIKAHLGLSWVYLKSHNLQGAFNEAAKVVLQEPHNARGHALVGTVLLRSGYLDKAFDHLKLALTTNSREALALATAAEIDLYENRVSAAYDKLKIVTNIQSDEPDYWLLFARCASRQQLFKEAANGLRQFLSSAPKTDTDRRARIEGVIKFYTFLGGTQVYQVKGKSTGATIQIKGRRPYLAVKVNGKETLNFVIDTGAGISVISTDAAQRLGIKEIARGGNARAVGGEGNFTIVYGLVDDLEIGTIKVSNVPVYIREIHAPENTKPEDIADGFLGLSVLSNFLLTLDYKNAEIRLGLPDDKQEAISLESLLGEHSQATVVPFRTTESGLISVEAKIDDDNILNFIFDSGASSSVISTATVAAQHWDKKILPNDIVKVIGAAGVTENVKILRAKKLQLNDLMRENLRMPILNLTNINEQAGFEQQGILGGDFLNSCRIQIDFRTLKILITPHISGLVKKTTEVVNKEGQN